MPTDKNFEQTVARMEKHEADAQQILADGLGKTWDASDLAYFAAEKHKFLDYVETLRKVFNGEKLAG